MSDFHGRFIWYELMTPDMAGAKAFYGDVTGWTTSEMPSPDMAYWVVEADGEGVGGMMELTEEAKARGAPPNWTGYVAVDDVDAAVEKLKGFGGSVIRPPEDIPGVGRFAIVADPAGAVIAIMTPVPMDPPRPEAPPGALGHTGWHELYGGKPETAFTFYAAMFGWTEGDAMEIGPMGTYQLFNNQDGGVGGMMAKPENIPAPAWLYYFRVGDIDAAAGRVTAGGGRVLNGPMEVPNGEWIVQGLDPQGAMFALVGSKA